MNQKIANFSDTLSINFIDWSRKNELGSGRKLT